MLKEALQLQHTLRQRDMKNVRSHILIQILHQTILISADENNTVTTMPEIIEID
jgi:hypothetical protein